MIDKLLRFLLCFIFTITIKQRPKFELAVIGSLKERPPHVFCCCKCNVQVTQQDLLFFSQYISEHTLYT